VIFHKTPPRIPARGELAGQLINTTVDSEVAKYYLEQYLQDRRNNPDLDLIINQAHMGDSGAIPSRDYLKYLSQRFSPDFAALYLAKKILEDSANMSIYRTFEEELARARIDVKTGEYRLDPAFRSYIILFVPGWVYKSEPESGADFAKPRAIITRYGVENHLIQIEETGTIEENADYIAEELIRVNRMEREIILVSASSGGASASLALGKLLGPSDLKNVKAWVNIGGLLQGSFLADASIRWPNRWVTKIILFFRNWDYDSIESMTIERSRERFREIKLPGETFCVNYVGIPLSGNITKRGKGGYLSARAEGPNDGMTLLVDALMPDCLTIPMLGIDHYFGQEMDVKTIALSRTVMRYLKPKSAGGQY